MALAHSPRIVADGLVLALDAGNTKSYPGSGTTWSDLSGNVNNGTLVNGVGYSNGALSFDGVDDYVISSSNIGITGDFNATLSVWVNLLELSTGYRCVCMFGSVGTMQGFGIFPNIAAYGAGSVAIGFYGSQNAYTAASTISANTWYNIVATKTSGAVSSSNTKLYINGISQNLTFATSSTPNATNNKVYIGNDPASEVSNNMRVANLSIYNRALTTSEIQQNYNALKSRFIT
jgi:hypothetical protein